MSPHIVKKVTSFFSRYKEQHLSKGQLLIRGGQPPEGVFFLQQGLIRQYDITESGDEIVVNVFKAPAFLPMSWALNHNANRYFFESFTPIVVRKAPAQDVIHFLHDNPDVMLDLLSRVYRGIDAMQNRMTFMMQNSARRRILFELLHSCQRFGEQKNNGNYMIAMHENELAARIGLTRETVNRELRSLKKRALVLVSQSGITITSLAALEKELYPDK